MKMGMTRLDGRSPSRTLAFATVPCRRLAAREGQPIAPAPARGAAPDIIELILADHKRIGRLLPANDDARCGEDAGCPGARPWSNARAALAGVDACRAGAESARVVRGSAAERRDPHRRPAGPSGCAASDGRRHARRPAGLRLCRNITTAQARRGQVRAALAARSAGRIPGPSSRGHRADQRPARSGPARAAGHDAGLCLRTSARRGRCGRCCPGNADEFRSEARLRDHRPGRRSRENCGQHTIERNGNGSGAASRGDLR
jgi:hypothetical protein